MDKRVIYIFLCAVLVLGFSACGKSKPQNNSLNSYSKENNDVYNSEQFKMLNKNTEADKNITETYINITDLDFLSSKTGFMCLSCCKTSNGSTETTYKLLKTEDGGCHWSNIDSKNNLIRSVIFIDDKLGFGEQLINKNGEDSGTVWIKTADGGITWNPVDFIKGKNPLQVDIIDKNIMFIDVMSGKAGTDSAGPIQIYRTTDGGVSWSFISLPDNKNYDALNGMSWLSSAEGYILCKSQAGAGNEPKILYYTNNGGKNWTIESKSELKDLNLQKTDNSIGIRGYSSGIKFFPDKTGYLGLSRGAIRKSTDGGKTFCDITEYGEHHPVPDFINNKEGYAIFNNTDLYYTADGGAHWKEIISMDINLWEMLH